LRTISSPFIKKQQNGIVLLVLVIIIALTLSAYYFSSISVVDIETENQLQAQLALKKAKKALLDYAVAHWSDAGEAGKLGKLPCPDYIVGLTEGEQDSMCGTAYANAIGYFPWRTLGIDVQKDGAGNCLIYAVSPAYKTTPLAALNPDSYGQLYTVDASGNVLQGVNPEDRLIAVIIAPDKPLPAQVRNIDSTTICGYDYGNIAAYLDNDGATNNAALNTGVDNVIDRFVHMYPGSEQAANPLNDRLITISYKEFWDALQSTITSTAFNNRMENLTEAVALCFAAYGLGNGKHLPMPAPLDLNGGEYRNSIDYDDSGVFTAGFAGRLPYDISQANTKLPTPTPANKPYIFDNTFCNNLVITTAGGEVINFTDDAGTDQGEYFDLWSNWKDHFLYAVSKTHNPAATVAPCTMMNCVGTFVKRYAGMIFFSGLKQGGQKRYSPPFDGALALDGVNDKDDVANYLEEGRDANFPDNNGNKSYSHVDSGNDIMFCINTDMSVEECQ
jgi:hypothetical protein